MLQTLSRLSLACAVVAAAAACPGIGDIDRTQPEKVKKSIFFNDDGTPAEFYFRQTVIDVPATSGVTFIGEQGDTERVVFELTQNFLFAYRAYGWLENDAPTGALEGNQGDGYVRPGTGPYQGAPVAAFAIQSHFDVKRQYNSATGEQTNVISEDSQDRPWYQREYIRVDWSTNHIADFRFGSSTALQTPASVAVPEEDNVDNPKEAPIVTPEYIDIVTKYNVEPEAIDFSWYGYGMIPECYFYSSMYKDCLGGTIKMRSSFKRVTKSDYLPQIYDDLRFQKFGFFRTERFRYNDEYGVVEPAQVRLANRWNLWKDAASCYDPEANKPYGACKPEQLRTVVYYLNEDFPKAPSELRRVALGNADSWNALLREAVLASTGWSESDLGDHRMFTICANNPVQDGDPEECGPVGTNPQIGDLRYSMYYYISNFQFSPPLGYGPSAADPLTGEIIQGNAFYYGAAGATIAARTRDAIKLQLGILKPEDITGGLPAQQSVAAAQQAFAASQRVRQMPENIGEKVRRLAENLRVKESGARLRSQIDSGVALHDKRPGRLEALKNSGLDEAVLTDEMREVFGPHLLEEGLNPSDADSILAARLFDDEVMFRRERLRQQRLLTPAARGCILSAEDVFDEGLLGLTAQVAKFYDTLQNPPVLKPGFTEDDVYNFILAQTLGDTQLHEVGHTMGLRHNFAGSTDALNYGPEYWTLRGDVRSASSPRPLAEWDIRGNAATNMEAALNSGLRDYQDSSVMDYASTYGTSLELGKYDLAAIKYAYGDVVEVFNSPDINAERAKLLKQGELHYLYYPEVVSNADSYESRVAAMYDRQDINFRNVPEDRIEVPYVFCSDEYRDASATCAIWDQGADNYERTVYMANTYRNYSIFNQFKRERLTFGLDIYGYLARVYTRDMTYILNQYKNWVNDELIIRSGRPCLAMENGQIVQQSDDRFASDACGFAGFLGTVEAVNLFSEILQQPDVGCYTRLKPGCYDTVAGNASPGSALDSPNIRLVDEDPDACDSYVPAQPTNDRAERRVALKVTALSQYNHVRDSLSCENYQPVAPEYEEEPVELRAAAGGARPANTIYDRDKYGYYFYIKPVLMGSWWDKWLAVKAFGDSNTDFIGVDASSDTRSFLISLNTIFGDTINNIIGGAVTDNVNIYGPILNEDGELEIVPALDVLSGASFNRATLERPVINPDQQYTFRLLAMMNAAYNGQATDRFEFGESLYVSAAYNLTDVSIPDEVRNDPSTYVEVTDPVTNIKWFAFNQHRAGADDLYSIGYSFLRELKEHYYVGGVDGPGTELLPAFREDAEYLPRQDFDIARIMSSTAARFGYSDVWEGDIDF